MVDFKKLIKKVQPVNASDLVALFESGDRQTSHTELRPAQRQALEALTSRLDERDLILKVSTGAGKTTAGLLYLQSHMLRAEQPVVYLCPTVQLVEQVCGEARRIGLSAVPYPGRETYPPVDGTSASAIIVCTYDKLFNGLSTFDRDDVQLRPCAIVLDDAHSGVDKIRDNFRLSISSGHDAFERILALLEPSFRKQFPGRWDEIRSRDIRESVEVPYWIWKAVLTEVEPILAQASKDKPNCFPWPLVRDNLRWCRCIISGAGIEVVPLVLPVDRCRAFGACQHRLFMSATLADDSALVRDLGCSADAVRTPILPALDKGLGERMVLPPTLISPDLNRQWVAETCKRLAKRVNVVVLSPSDGAAEFWAEFGAERAGRDDVAGVVRRLREEKSGNYVVFAQRYDGVDLPDDACRVLVLDGMPSGESITDSHDSSLSDGVRRRIVHRIEQGMGRAVRSHVDYAVIILAGPALAQFVAKADVLAAMNPDTQAQLRLAIDLAKLAVDEEDPEDALFGMIRKCLDRDASWKAFYQERVRDVPRQTPKLTQQEAALQMAAEVRASYLAATAHDSSAAASALIQAANKHTAPGEERAPFLQLVANYTFETDEGKALEIQRSAHSVVRTLFCPPSVEKRARTHTGAEGPAIILRWYRQFENPNGAVAAVHDLRARLAYDASTETIEQALLELAPLIGAEGSRPEAELGEGPDDLWLWPSAGILIEAKTQNEETLHKKDGGQLLQSLQWFERAYPTRPAPLAVVVAKSASADRRSDFPEATRVLTPSGLAKLLENTESLYRRMAREPLLFSDAKLVGEALAELRLQPEQFRAAYTEELRRVK